MLKKRSYPQKRNNFICDIIQKQKQVYHLGCLICLVPPQFFCIFFWLTFGCRIPSAPKCLWVIGEGFHLTQQKGLRKVTRNRRRDPGDDQQQVCYPENRGPKRISSWWKKSCTSWQVVYPMIYKVLYILGGCLGFLPSTVWIISQRFSGGNMGAALAVSFRVFYILSPQKVLMLMLLSGV